MEEVKQEVDNTPTEQKEATPVVQTSQEEQPENAQQVNWRKFREVREKERKEKVEVEKRAAEKEKEVAALKAAMEALVNKPSSNNHQMDEYSEETDEQRIAKLVDAALEKERYKRQTEDQERERQEFPQRLNRDFPDFQQTCTSENLDYLEYHYPEVAEAYKHMPDGYNKWAAVYKAVKRFTPGDVKRNQAKAENNLGKPQSMSIPGKTATGDTAPQYLDDKKKMDNWDRMVRTMKKTV